MVDNEQHLRDLQREYLDFLDDEVNKQNNKSSEKLIKIKMEIFRRIKESIQVK